MAQYNVNNYDVQELMSWITTGAIAIPEIQRPFVWDKSQVRDFIDSLYRSYPVGYITIWQKPDVRLRDGTTSNNKKILIDGQQRLMALRAAILGKEVFNKDYKNEHIQISFNPIEERFEVLNAAIKKDSRWIPDIAQEFNRDFPISFVVNYCNNNGQNIDDIGKIFDKLKEIKSRPIGVIELSASLSIDEVTNIFIRINSKGVKLSQSDFAMSVMSSDERYDGSKIRKTIDYFCHIMRKPADLAAIKNSDREFAESEEFTKIKWIADGKNYSYLPDYADVLRVVFTFKFKRGKLPDLVSLLSGRDFRTRVFLDSIAQQTFSDMKDGLMQFINQTNFQHYSMILRSLGIIKPLNSQNILNFGYALYLLLKSKGVAQNIIDHVVRRWIVVSILTGRYSGSSESAFEHDIKCFDESGAVEYLHNAEAGELSDTFWNITLPEKLTVSSQNAMFQVFCMAQVHGQVISFLSNNMSVDNLLNIRGDVHHIFPKKYLQSHGIDDKNKYNQIANYAYTESWINNQISDKAPKDYMSVVKKQCEDGNAKIGNIVSSQKLEHNMSENCIPKEIFDMDYNDYDKFLELRRKLMAQKIREYYEAL